MLDSNEFVEKIVDYVFETNKLLVTIRDTTKPLLGDCEERDDKDMQRLVQYVFDDIIRTRESLDRLYNEAVFHRKNKQLDFMLRNISDKEIFQ